MMLSGACMLNGSVVSVPLAVKSQESKYVTCLWLYTIPAYALPQRVMKDVTACAAARQQQTFA